MAKAFDSTADVQAGKWVEGQVAVVSINTFLRMLISIQVLLSLLHQKLKRSGQSVGR